MVIKRTTNPDIGAAVFFCSSWTCQKLSVIPVIDFNNRWRAQQLSPKTQRSAAEKACIYCAFVPNDRRGERRCNARKSDLCTAPNVIKLAIRGKGNVSCDARGGVPESCVVCAVQIVIKVSTRVAKQATVLRKAITSGTQYHNFPEKPSTVLEIFTESNSFNILKGLHIQA